jgi:hypothetical protein
MPQQPAKHILLFDPQHILRCKKKLNHLYHPIMAQCHTYPTLMKLYKKHKETLHTIIYCAPFYTTDLDYIKQLKNINFIPQFILISNRFTIQNLKQIVHLGIFAIHDEKVHVDILNLDLKKITTQTNPHPMRQIPSHQPKTLIKNKTKSSII